MTTHHTARTRAATEPREFRYADPTLPRLRKASDIIKHAPSHLQRGRQVILFPRVSEQVQRPNLTDQLSQLREAAQEHGWVEVGVASDSEGNGLVMGGKHPLYYQAHELHEQYPDAVLLVTTTDRLIRPGEYTDENMGATYTPGDLRRLSHATRGLELYTLEDPDRAYLGEGGGHGVHVKRGHEAKGNRGGAGQHGETRAARKRRLMPLVRRLSREGLSLTAIQKAVIRIETAKDVNNVKRKRRNHRLSIETIRQWLRRQ
jgi:hypothetical protein